MARDYQVCEKWSPGVVTKQTGPVSYEVNVRGQIWNRHAEQLRPAAGTDASTKQLNEERDEVDSESNQCTRPRGTLRNQRG